MAKVVITRAGLYRLLEMAFLDTVIKKFRYVGFGSGDNPPSEYDSGLQAEFKRVETVPEILGNTVYINATFLADADYVVREIGVFDEPDVNSGVMLARAVFDTPVYVYTNDLASFTLTIKFG